MNEFLEKNSDISQNKDQKQNSTEITKKQNNLQKLPENIRKLVLSEQQKIKNQHPSEQSITQNYIDTLLDLPWSETTQDNPCLTNAKQLLDNQHYSLSHVKQRILEFLAVKKLTVQQENQQNFTILCLSGPPGVGKTTLGQSIADSLNRKFHILSLGGIRDESEIRGHRRTYIGSFPGIIIQALRQVKSNNPVILLDEIDKVGVGNRGDIMNCLLEVLDPVQNKSFKDHYLSIGFDLSKILFIATANSTSEIKPALKDRLEIIKIPGYTQQEKFQITKKHIIPKLIKQNGIQSLKISDQDINFIIQSYAREPGIRQIEKQLSSICRNQAYLLATDQKQQSIDQDKIIQILGQPIYNFNNILKQLKVGESIGLAYTGIGGKIMYIESSKSIGNGKIEITGSLGKVMKESVMTSLGWIKSNWGNLENQQIFENQEKDNYFSTINIFIHFPEASIDKDGPSAGIAITTSLLSMLVGKKCRNIAMTGEMSLLGNVLPVGGLKEKFLAAYEAGIKEIIISKQNEKDLIELSQEIKDNIKFILVEHISEVIQTVFGLDQYMETVNKITKL